MNNLDVHDNSGNVSKDFNCEVSIYFYLKLLKIFFYEYGVHEQCANSIFEPCSNFANELCINSKSMSLKGSFGSPSKKPCSKSEFLDIDQMEINNVNKRGKNKVNLLSYQ